MINKLILKLFILNCFLLKSALFYPNYEDCSKKYLESETTDATILKTSNGQVRGNCFKVIINDPSEKNRSNDLFTWLGIPYAEPPINKNRFKAPKPVQNWKDVRDGTQFPNKCVETGYIEEKADYPILKTNTSEDCLYLNIYVPAYGYVKSVLRNEQNSLMPVLIFIHGGGFVYGSSVEDYYDASTLAALSNVIVVTINYRLGIFGLLTIENTEAVGNVLLRDQNMALKWVYENARLFGGDSNRITISGESAGSFSVGYHLLYEQSWPYFRNAILQSGSPTINILQFLSIQEATRRSKEILAMNGCNLTMSNEKLLECAQSISAEKIVTNSENFKNEILCNSNRVTCITVVAPILFVIDGDVFKEEPISLFKNGHYKKANILLGFDKNEGGYFTSFFFDSNTNVDRQIFRNFINDYFFYYPQFPQKPTKKFFQDLYEAYLNESYTDIDNNEISSSSSSSLSLKYLNALSDIIGEMIFICPSLDLASIYSKSNDVYLYSYEYRITTSPYAEIFGVVHGDELPMTFGEPLSIKKYPLISANVYNSVKYNYSDVERLFSKQVITYWTNFVKYDNPNGNLAEKESIRWPLYKTSEYYFRLLPQWLQYALEFLNKLISKQDAKTEYLILKANEIRKEESFKERHCDFWRKYF